MEYGKRISECLEKYNSKPQVRHKFMTNVNYMMNSSINRIMETIRDSSQIFFEEVCKPMFSIDKATQKSLEQIYKNNKNVKNYVTFWEILDILEAKRKERSKVKVK